MSEALVATQANFEKALVNGHAIEVLQEDTELLASYRPVPFAAAPPRPLLLRLLSCC